MDSEFADRVHPTATFFTLDCIFFFNIIDYFKESKANGSGVFRLVIIRGPRTLSKKQYSRLVSVFVWQMGKLETTVVKITRRETTSSRIQQQKKIINIYLNTYYRAMTTIENEIRKI